MRKVFLIASLLFLTGTLKLTAQELIVTTPDTVKIIAPPVMDSSFYLKSIIPKVSFDWIFQIFQNGSFHIDHKAPPSSVAKWDPVKTHFPTM